MEQHCKSFHTFVHVQRLLIPSHQHKPVACFSARSTARVPGRAAAVRGDVRGIRVPHYHGHESRVVSGALCELPATRQQGTTVDYSVL